MVGVRVVVHCLLGEAAAGRAGLFVLDGIPALLRCGWIYARRVEGLGVIKECDAPLLEGVVRGEYSPY